MRIAQVLLAPRIGGAETIAHALEEELADRGHVVSTHHLDPAAGERSRIGRVRHLRAELRATRPDLVLGHGALPNIYARAVVPGRRVITVLHSAVDDFADSQIRVAERLLRHRTAAVIAVSEELSEQYGARFGAGVPVLVVPNGVSRTFAPPEVPPAARPIRVVTLARVAAQKDPATWLTAASLLADRRSDVIVEWYGPDDPDEPLAHRVAALPGDAAARVRFMGPVQDPARVLRGASLLLHTAVAESQGLALFEAAASGVPVVCSSAIGADIVEEVGASVFPVGDGRAAADAAEAALAERPSSPARLTIAARVRERYGMGRCAAAYEQVLLAHAGS